MVSVRVSPEGHLVDLFERFLEPPLFLVQISQESARRILDGLALSGHHWLEPDQCAVVILALHGQFGQGDSCQIREVPADHPAGGDFLIQLPGFREFVIVGENNGARELRPLALGRRLG